MTFWFEGSFEEGIKQIYPCRCGITHKGPYGAYDFGHHNCLHEADLILLSDGLVCCTQCGKPWELDREHKEPTH